VLTSHVGLPGQGGAVGVTLFFVLSGFLITDLLVAEQDTSGTIQLGRFYFRRAYRLVPALILYLVGAGLIAAWRGMNLAWIWNETWPPLLYATNYAHLTVTELDMNWHAWSLAVEEHFYLAWPLILLAIPVQRRVRSIVIGLLVLFTWSVIAWSYFPEWGYSSTDANAYALAAGCLVALVRRNGVRLRTPTWLPLFGVVAIVSLTTISAHVVRQPLVVMLSVVTVLACVGSDEGVLAVSPLRFMGRVSYGTYLWHVPLLMIAGAAIENRITAALASIAVAWPSWVVLERHVLARREHDWTRLTSRIRPSQSAANVSHTQLEAVDPIMEGSG